MTLEDAQALFVELDSQEMSDMEVATPSPPATTTAVGGGDVTLQIDADSSQSDTQSYTQHSDTQSDTQQLDSQPHSPVTSQQAECGSTSPVYGPLTLSETHAQDQSRSRSSVSPK